MPTTIQTIKEAEEKIPHTKECIQANKELGEKFGMEFGKKCMCDRPKKISELHQTLLAVFESELESVPEDETDGSKLGYENSPEIYGNQRLEAMKKGINQERARQRSHLTEVINYLKQK